MKFRFRFFAISTITALLGMLAPAWVTAQTNPAPQSLPYSQDFSSLPYTGTGSTVYPAGWQGWNLAATPGGSYVTNGPVGDKGLQNGGGTGSNASISSNGAHNYNGKVGSLNSSSADNGLALAINSTGFAGVMIRYDIMTIRNPHNGSSDTRINEVSLQFRVGTSGSWTTLTGMEYQNNTVTKITAGDTNPQKLETKVVTLPSSADNKPVVQLRWASREVSGTGSRPSFAIDNVIVGNQQTETLLSLFQASSVDDGVELRWQFGASAQFATVAVERGDGASGPWDTIELERREEAGMMVALDRSVEAGRTYYYRLHAWTPDGEETTFGPMEATAGAGVTEFAIASVAPNPTPGRTRIEYTVSREGKARLSVLDVQGREVALLADGVHRTGRYQAVWSGEMERGVAPAGVYFIRYQVAGMSLVRRVVLSR